MMPSLTARRLEFVAPDGYRLGDPSLALHRGRIVLLQPTVERSEPGRSRHFLLSLSDDLTVQSSAEIMLPAEAVEAGLADPRLVAWRDRLWWCARLGPRENGGESEWAIACPDDGGLGPTRLTNWCVVRPRVKDYRNWMPRVVGPAADPSLPARGQAPADAGRLQFIIGWDPIRVVDDEGLLILESTPAIAAEQFEGGTPAIRSDACFGEGTGDGWIAVVNEVDAHEGERHYQHRWVWLDEASVLRRVSLPFFLDGEGIGRPAGLALHPDGRHILISYGIDDKVWIAQIAAADVHEVLEDVERLHWGEAGDGRRGPVGGETTAPKNGPRTLARNPTQFGPASDPRQNDQYS